MKSSFHYNFLKYCIPKYVMHFPIYEHLKSASDFLRLWIYLIVEQLFFYFQWFEENWTTVSVTVLLYIIICTALYFTIYNAKDSNNIRSSLINKDRILFIISHPDDECMFFGPTVVSLSRFKDKNVFLLCLSYGDYYLQGRTRKNELWKSCSILGIPESNIFLHKLTLLPDDPNVAWNEDVISNLIMGYVETLRFDAVITFDKDGVSGHLNHKAVYYSVAQAMANHKFPNFCSVYCLNSVNKMRKFSLIFDIIFSVCFSSNWFILSPNKCHLIKNALLAHETQNVWFRKLYIWISRYAYINTFSMLYVNDAMLDINFRDVCT